MGGFNRKKSDWICNDLFTLEEEDQKLHLEINELKNLIDQFGLVIASEELERVQGLITKSYKKLGQNSLKAAKLVLDLHSANTGRKMELLHMYCGDSLYSEIRKLCESDRDYDFDLELEFIKQAITSFIPADKTAGAKHIDFGGSEDLKFDKKYFSLTDNQKDLWDILDDETRKRLDLCFHGNWDVTDKFCLDTLKKQVS